MTPISISRPLTAVAVAAFLAACGGNGGAAAPAGTAAASPVGSTNARPSVTAVTILPTRAPSLAALALAWEKSGPEQPAPCCQTWWPSVNPKSGEIWVSDAFANEFWIFSPDGAFKGTFGSTGTGPGQFDFSAHREQPQAVGAIAFAPDGSFYVADAGNHRVQHFDAARRSLGSFGTFGSGDGQFVNPFGIATDGTTVYVADDDRGDIQAFSADGRFLRSFGPIITEAGLFIAVDPHGTLYRSAGVAQPGRILEYDAAGAVATTLDIGFHDAAVLGLTFDAKGNLFASLGYEAVQAKELVEIAPGGKVIGHWSTGGETIGVDAKGTAIYAASDKYAGWPTASLRKYVLP